jgi:lipid A ethanolaminephosphotransferase
LPNPLLFQSVARTQRAAQPRLTSRPEHSPVWLAYVSATALVVLYNVRFWSETFAQQNWSGAGSVVFVASLFLVLVAVYGAVLLLIPGVRLLKSVLVVAVLAAAVGAYFENSYGVAIDREMIRNVAQTDLREAATLLNARFVLYLVLLGVLPAVLIGRTRIAAAGVLRELSRRAVAIAGSLVFCAAVALLLGAQYASFLREHKALRYLLTPANIVNGVVAYLGAGPRAPAHFADLESPVIRAGAAGSRKPLVMFLVIGETARAQNFQLGGYPRPTNPELSKRGVYYFPDTSACGTSTAVSLPCMFSGTPRRRYDPGRALHATNLLDALSKAGLFVEWRDNNSGCKGLCERVRSTGYAQSSSASLCNAAGCLDEVMLENLDATLAEVKTDTVIVFHQAGSHGPAYSERYPKRFEIFKPVCYGNELSRCTKEEVVNAYVISLRYTDYVVARQIDALQAAADKVDGVLVYVSDHGESLGEKGLYLHGAPYLFAPEEQTHVPMLMWMSRSYRERFGIAAACVEGKKAGAYSHDNLYHTVLGALGIRTARYESGLDMLASCRGTEGAAPGDVVGMR